jgi:hypothetical protein
LFLAAALHDQRRNQLLVTFSALAHAVPFLQDKAGSTNEQTISSPPLSKRPGFAGIALLCSAQSQL